MLARRFRFQLFRRAHQLAPGLMRPHHPGPIVLLYHNVERIESPLVRGLHITLTPEHFESHLRYLKQHHHLIPFSRLNEHHGDPDAVAITFDDGCKSVITEALPIIERYGCPVKLYLTLENLGSINWLNKLSYLLTTLPQSELLKLADAALEPTSGESSCATIFDFIGRFQEGVTPNVVDEMFTKLHRGPIDELYMSETDVRKILDHPLIELGSHTRRHYPLSRISSSSLRAEVVDAHQQLNQMFNKRMQGFCIPFGYRSELTQSIVDAIRQIDRQAVTAYGGGLDDSTAFGLPEVKRTGIWGNIGVLWHRMRWPN